MRCGICGLEVEQDLLPSWTHTQVDQFVTTAGAVTAEGKDPVRFGIQLQLQFRRIMVAGDYSDRGYPICGECRGNLLRAIDQFLGELLKVSAFRRGRTWTRVPAKCHYSGERGSNHE